MPRLPKYLLVTALLGAMALSGIAQEKDKEPKRSKKLQAMMEWQEQQRKQEEYDKVVQEAHRLFQQDRYKEAQNRYRDALDIVPNDQRAIAKITDIQLVMDSIASASAGRSTTTLAVEPAEPPPTPEPPAVEAPVAQHTPIEEVEPAPPRPPKSLEELLKNLPIRRPDITGLPENTAPAQPIAEAAPAPATELEAEPKPEPTPAPKPRVEVRPTKPPVLEPAVDKSSPEFAAELAQTYPTGWTVEETTEGGKTVLRKIYVAENQGTEYMRVRHNWGGVYYFRNGTPITRDLFDTETAEADQ